MIKKNEEHEISEEENLRIMQKLRNKQMQNFSSILNASAEQASYYEEIKNLIINTVYDEKSILDIEINKDFDRFSDFIIEMGNSPRSINSDNPKSFRELTKQNFDNYSEALSKDYRKYAFNHFKVNYNNNNIYLNDNSDLNNLNDGESNYKTNEKIFNEIPKEFIVNCNLFKIKSEILNANIEEIQNNCITFIDYNSKIDLELQRILKKNEMIENYISGNSWPSLNGVNCTFNKIKEWKNIYKELKSKNYKNSLFLLTKKIKQQNLKKIILFMKSLKEVQNNLSFINDINSKDNTSSSFELISKGRELIEKLKNNTGQKELKLYDFFEETFSNYLSKNSSSMTNEFSNIMTEYFNGFIVFQESKENTSQTYHISQLVLDKLKSIENCDYVIKHINFESKNKIESIINIIENYIKTRLIDSFYSAVKEKFINISNQVFENINNTIIDKIKNNNNNIVQDNEKNEQTILLCLLYGKNKLYSELNLIINQIIDLINKSELISKELKDKFSDIFIEINENINDNLMRKIKIQTVNCLNQALHYSDIDSFADSFYIIYDILKNILKDEKIFNFLKDCQINYMKKWINERNSKFQTSIFKNWEEIKEIPSDYQNFIEIISTYEIKDNYIQIEEQFSYEKISIFKNLESKFKINKSLGFIIINNIKLKCNQCSLDIIKLSYEILKIFTFFNTKVWDNILENYINLLTSHVDFQKEQILNGKNIEVTQTEISMANSILVLIKQISEKMKNTQSFGLIAKYTEQHTIDNFLQMQIYINKQIEFCQQKIIDLIQLHCIDDSISELKKISLPNYNVVDGKLPVNNYSLKLVSLIKTIYDCMLNSYDEEFIKSTIKKCLSRFFDNFENYIINGKKIENINSLKQFKRDTIFFKKNLPFLTLINMDEFKIRIDSLNKKVLPENMLKSKKRTDK